MTRRDTPLEDVPTEHRQTRRSAARGCATAEEEGETTCSVNGWSNGGWGRADGQEGTHAVASMTRQWQVRNHSVLADTVNHHRTGDAVPAGRGSKGSEVEGALRR